MWIDRGDKMNELQICNENQALIDMQIDACNTAVNFFETNLSKGQRDFVTQMGKLSLKAKEIQLKEDELQTKYDIAEMKENNKFRLATIDFRRDERQLLNINRQNLQRKQEFVVMKLLQKKKSI